ncbi:ABC transporter permease [Phycisphaerales bacterium AB-hyl4]|uniref:ABC transporter permease n=1 Tax=Natronomicrosphaera hydrolytica TaxID=3242702 RepID=A0ABV4U3G5_9BACT
MLKPELWLFVFKQILRRPTRSGLTVVGVAIAMFLFAAVQTMQQGLETTTRQTAEDTALIVFQQGRFCASTSRLPERYGQAIAQMPGVKRVTPMRVVVSNCRAGLDVVTYRGVPAERWADEHGVTLKMLDGSLARWQQRRDAAIVGRTLAQRRGVQVGDSLEAAGVRVQVAGILDSDDPQDLNVAYVHLDFLQRAVGPDQLGVVTQFNVQVDDPQRLDATAQAIDERFAHDEAATATSSEKGFIAQAAGDAVQLIAFTRYVGWGCLIAVLGLIANSIVLSVQDRIKEHAVLQTLGFTGGQVARLIVVESLVLGLLGGLIGCGVALWVMHAGQFALSSEGFSIPFIASPATLLWGLLISMVLGVAAGLVPAWQASRREIASCFRAV